MATNALKIIAIIDGDHLVHRAEWKNSFKDSKVKIDLIIQDIIDSVFADDYLLAIKGDDNFRKEIFPDYKGHRNRSLELDHRIEALLQYMVDKYGAVRSHGWEADDQCHQWHRALSEDKSIIPVICSVDKDLYTIPGIHYNIREDRILHIDASEADYYLHLQLLMGDATDRIQGVPGIGPIKAKRILDKIPYGARTARVKEEYKKYYGDSWEEEFQLTGNLVYIRHQQDKGFDL